MYVCMYVCVGVSKDTIDDGEGQVHTLFPDLPRYGLRQGSLPFERHDSFIWCRALQCVAVSCNEVQCVAVCCSVLQFHVMARASNLCHVNDMTRSYVAVCHSVLHCVLVPNYGLRQGLVPCEGHDS